MKTPSRIGLFLLLAATLASPLPAHAQGTDAALPGEEEKVLSPAAQRFRSLTEPETPGKKKERTKPLYEFYRSQIAPFDVLPYVKPGHWNTLNLEMVANYNDYAGLLQTEPVRLADMPHAITYRREARLLKEQDARLGFQIMLPNVPKELLVELTRPDAIRADGGWQASFLKLEPHQMLIPVLSPEPSVYIPWARLNAVIPSSGDKDMQAIEKQRYYRFVLPQKPDKPQLSPHPLTWTTSSHLIWDGQEPDTLGLGQQRAMVDWLHWGGQIIVIGSGPVFASLQDSFLGPYLPATPSGENASLGEDDLKTLVQEYPPPLWPNEWEDQIDFDPQGLRPPRYKEPEKGIVPGPLRPVLFSGLTPRPGATPLPLDPEGRRLLGVEWRVGRGRVLILAFNPLDPAFAQEAWPGMDNFVRRVVLRRPEEPYGGGASSPPGVNAATFYSLLRGPDLSWFRILARDLGAQQSSNTPQPGDIALPTDGVAAWSDTASMLPGVTRKALEDASGISIPASSFVLKVILAYIVALVPLNWLVCRYVLRRREWAWAVVPLLSLGFAYAVERAAAYDLGFDSACDEIDLLEIHGNYTYAHLSRFAALYSTGRDKYTIAYPDEPTALALPLNMQRSLRGEEDARSVFQSTPDPALVDFQVQPRSLAMFRAEAMVDIGGVIQLDESGGPGQRKVINASNLELHDAALIDMDSGHVTPLGTIAPGATADESKPVPSVEGSTGSEVDWLDVGPFLIQLSTYRFGRPEDGGEVRLVALATGPHPGQVLEPAVDRHRGFRLVVAHLKYGPPPDPGRPPYYSRDDARFRTPTYRSMQQADDEPGGTPPARSKVRIRRPR